MASRHDNTPDARELLNPRDRSIKAVNRRKIVRSVMVGPSSQVQIARRTDLSQAKISAEVQDLVRSGVVTVHEGERGKTVRLREMDGVAAGVEVGHERLSVAVRRLGDDRVFEAEQPVGARHGVTKWVAASADLIRRLSADAGSDAEKLVSIGLGIPAVVDPRTAKAVMMAPSLGWDLKGDPRAWFANDFPDVPVVPDNDANFAAFGEHLHGVARGVETLVFVKASTGIGAGIIIGGFIYRGESGRAGEIGHQPHQRPDRTGRVCNCGRRGCLETIAGGVELLDQVRTAYRGYDVNPPKSLDDLVDRARGQDDPVSLSVVQEAARAIGGAVLLQYGTLDPAIIVIGGEVGRGGQIVIEPINEVLHQSLVPPPNRIDEAPLIRPSALGMMAGALGALSYALLTEGAFTLRG